MENTNEDAQLDVVEQEEVTSQEEHSFDDSSEETITIPKSKFNQIRRKAVAYDANKEKPKTNTTNNSDSSWKQRMELKVEGYNDDEVDLIMKNGGKKALENKYVTAAIDAVRTQKKAEAAMLGGEGQKSSTIGGLSPQEFSKLSAADQLKKLSEI